MPYLTGDSVPVGQKCRVVYLPDDPAFMAAFYGAMLELTYPYNWEQFGVLTPDEMARAFFDVFDILTESVCVEPETVIYPQHFDINCLLAKVVAGNGLLRTISTTQFFQYTMEQSPFTAAGNKMSFPFYCAAGQYDIFILAHMANNCGNFRSFVDGVNVNQDQGGYNSTAIANVRFALSSVDILTDGTHLLELEVNSKSASSSAYRLAVSSIFGIYTAALP